MFAFIKISNWLVLYGVGCMYVDTHAWWWYDMSLNRSITSKEERHFVKSGQQKCVTNLICVKHIGYSHIEETIFGMIKQTIFLALRREEIDLSYAQMWMIVCHDFWKQLANVLPRFMSQPQEKLNKDNDKLKFARGTYNWLIANCKTLSKKEFGQKSTRGPTTYMGLV